MSNYSEIWKQVNGLFRKVRTQLPDGGVRQRQSVPDGRLMGTLDEFDEFLEHNELELAWDALADVGERCGAPSIFWVTMARAADLMKLPEKKRAAEILKKNGLDERPK